LFAIIVVTLFGALVANQLRLRRQQARDSQGHEP
jgi:hypothetical protein